MTLHIQFAITPCGTVHLSATKQLNVLAIFSLPWRRGAREVLKKISFNCCLDPLNIMEKDKQQWQLFQILVYIPPVYHTFHEPIASSWFLHRIVNIVSWPVFQRSNFKFSSKWISIFGVNDSRKGYTKIGLLYIACCVCRATVCSIPPYMGYYTAFL